MLISSVPPLMVQTDANPGGLPKSVFDDLQAQLAANRSVFYRALPAGPFYGFNRPGVTPVEAIIENWWRQGMTGPLSAKLVQHGTLKTYHGYPHGMPTTQAATINADLLAWLKS